MDKEKIKVALITARDIAFVWVFVCVLGSWVKQMDDAHNEDNCGKSYPIGYIIYTDLFCEVDND